MYFHLDLDAFFATCETVLDPQLKGKPIAVVANPQGKMAARGVIASASYEARKFGIKSGMPQFIARQVYPPLIFVSPHTHFYGTASRAVAKILSSYSDKIYQYGLDEWYVDFREWRSVFAKIFKRENPELFIAQRIKSRIAKEIHPWLTCSIGIAPTKILAKIGSDYNKPDGIFVITKENFKEVIATLDLQDIPGIGPRTKRHLKTLGIHTTTQLINTNTQILINAFGILGANFKNFLAGSESGFFNSFGGNGQKSVSRSKTYTRNCNTRREIEARLLALCEEVGVELRTKKKAGTVIHTTLRFSDFSFRSHQKNIGIPTNDEYIIFNEAKTLLNTISLEKPVRLIGIGVSHLAPFYTNNLFTTNFQREKFLAVSDAIKKRYGHQAIRRAISSSE